MYEVKTTQTDWEDTLISLSQGPAQTEQQKYENAETAIRKAISAHSKLSGMDISVFVQGSYKARTNVRAESDVDICIRLNSSSFNDYPPEKSAATYGLGAGDINYDEYKKLVNEALINKFESKNLTFGSKAIKIASNTYRVDADAVPTFCHRRYHGPNPTDFIEGVAFYSDAGNLVINWPEQNYANGVTKNDQTNRRYKRIVRILKRLKAYMIEDGIAAAKVPSYLIQCLVWNVPNENFGNDSYYSDMRNVLAHLFNQTINDNTCTEWGEINELKYLFRSSQPWTRQQAHNFVSAVWDYIGYE
jgi:predicted nucleotidyltransferase